MEPTAEDFQIKLWDMKSTSLVQQFVQQNRCLTRVCLHWRFPRRFPDSHNTGLLGSTADLLPQEMGSEVSEKRWILLSHESWSASAGVLRERGRNGSFPTCLHGAPSCAGMLHLNTSQCLKTFQLPPDQFPDPDRSCLFFCGHARNSPLACFLPYFRRDAIIDGCLQVTLSISSWQALVGKGNYCFQPPLIFWYRIGSEAFEGPHG